MDGLPDDALGVITAQVARLSELGALAQTSGAWRDVALAEARRRLETDDAARYFACMRYRFRASGAPLRWLLRYHRHADGAGCPPLRCARCGHVVDRVGECRRLHWTWRDAVRRMVLGPAAALAAITLVATLAHAGAPARSARWR